MKQRNGMIIPIVMMVLAVAAVGAMAWLSWDTNVKTANTNTTNTTNTVRNSNGSNANTATSNKNSSVTVNTNTTTNVNTSLTTGTKTYTSTSYDYSFDYGSTLQLQSCSDGKIVIVGTTEPKCDIDMGVGMAVSVQDANYSQASTISNAGSSLNASTTIPVTIDGISGTRVQGTIKAGGISPGYWYDAVYVTHGTDSFIISNTQKTKQLTAFNALLASFSWE